MKCLYSKAKAPWKEETEKEDISGSSQLGTPTSRSSPHPPPKVKPPPHSKEDSMFPTAVTQLLAAVRGGCDTTKKGEVRTA
jgi:hypothetical protein